MRNATIPNGTSVTFFLIVINKATDFWGYDALVKTTLLIKNISQNIGSILFTRNKSGTGEQIAICSNNNSLRIYKAGQIPLPNLPGFHCNFVLNDTQIKIIAALL